MPPTIGAMQWYGPVSEFMRDDTRYIDLEGAFRCLTPWTPIQTDRAMRLIGEVFGASGFDVPTWDGSSRCTSRAGRPFLKAIRPAFRVHLDTGDYFDASDTHLVLTAWGWLSLGQLIRLSSGLRCWDTRRDWTASCVEDGRRDGGRLLAGPAIAGACTPSGGDALEQSAWRLWLEGGADTKSQHTHVSRASVLPSSRDAADQGVSRFGRFVDPTPAFDAEWCSAIRQDYRRVALEWGQRQASGQKRRGPSVIDVAAHRRDAFFPSSHPPLIGAVSIASIVSLGLQPIVDIEVAATHNYVAGGVVHHNSGKTTAALWKVLTSCIDHPGIHWLIGRVSEGDAFGKLRPPWQDALARAGVRPTWHAAGSYDQFDNGSVVYITGLKASEDTAKFSKIRGLTLAGVYIDQAEELSHELYMELAGRLSQSHVPHQLILTANPPPEDHWLADEFPADNHVKGHRYYRVSVYDNRTHLSKETLMGLEAAYPVGHAMHRSAILGERGLSIAGRPVYGYDPISRRPGVFRRDRHVGPVAVDPARPVLEALDYGHAHPCVVWAQLQSDGAFRVLGAAMGDHLYLEDFAPALLRLRARWFPADQEIWSCCDPAGTHESGHGIATRGIDVLRSHGILPRIAENSNHPTVRLACIERLASLMRTRTAHGEEAFRITDDPSHVLMLGVHEAPGRYLIDAFEAGYVWDEHVVSVGHQPLRRPKKDGYFDHSMNCVEYLAHHFLGQAVDDRSWEARSVARQQRQLRRAQADPDEPFSWRSDKGRHISV